MSKVPAEVLLERAPLTGNNLVAPGEAWSWVMSPLVFTKDGKLVLPRLQIDELLDIYDVEVITQKELGHCWRASHCAPSCAFVDAAPLKVLMEVVHFFYEKLNRDGWADGTAPVNENAGPRKRGCIELTALCSTGVGSSRFSEATIGQTNKKPRLHPRSTSLIADGEPASGLEASFSQEVVIEPSGLCVKAAKNDDAKVNIKQWDIWSVDNFEPSNGQSAMVCVAGSYCDRQHGYGGTERKPLGAS